MLVRGRLQNTLTACACTCCSRSDLERMRKPLSNVGPTANEDVLNSERAAARKAHMMEVPATASLAVSYLSNIRLAALGEECTAHS